MTNHDMFLLRVIASACRDVGRPPLEEREEGGCRGVKAQKSETTAALGAGTASGDRPCQSSLPSLNSLVLALGCAPFMHQSQTGLKRSSENAFMQLLHIIIDGVGVLAPSQSSSKRSRCPMTAASDVQIDSSSSTSRPSTEIPTGHTVRDPGL
jgi:hypothetical protein